MEKLTAEAVRLAKAGSWDAEAVEINSEILQISPDNVAALTRRGRCRYELAQYEAAREDYERALKIDPDNRIARNFLVRVERELSYRVDAERVGGITNFDEAYRLGMAAKEGGSPNHRLAIAALRQAFRLNARRYDVIVSLAATHRIVGELDEAQRLYDWLLARTESMAARVGLAAVYRDKKNLVQARKMYESIIALDESNVHALHGLAGVLRDMRQPDEAAKMFARAARFGGVAARDSIAKLHEIRDVYKSRNDDSRVRWIESLLGRLRKR